MDNKYFLLFNAITDIMNRLDEMKKELVKLQQKSEEMYIEENENGPDNSAA